MRRLFWVALGASAGVLVARQLRQTASALAPDNLAASLLASAREFWDEVREAMAEREVELREAFGFTNGPSA